MTTNKNTTTATTNKVATNKTTATTNKVATNKTTATTEKNVEVLPNIDTTEKNVEVLPNIDTIIKTLLMFKKKSDKKSDKESDKDIFNKKMSELSKLFANGKISYVDFAKQQKALEVQYLNKVSNNDKLLSIDDKTLDSFAEVYKLDRNVLNIITKKCQACFTQNACIVALESTIEFHKASYKKAYKELMESIKEIQQAFENENVDLHLIHLMHQAVKTTTSTKGLVQQASKALYNYYNTIIEDNNIQYYKE